MATARDYAEWIVRNKDLQGTPEFDTVAQAYQKAQQQETAAPAPAAKPDVTDQQGLNRKAFGSVFPMLGGQYAPDVVMGGRQVMDAGAQMLARAFGSRTADDTNQAALDQYKQNYGEMPGAGVARGIGQGVVTGAALPIRAATAAVPLVRGAINVGQGAGVGAASNALTPIYNADATQPFWEQKAQQAKEGAIAGGATAGVLGGASKLLGATRDARELMKEGITPTVGQTLGGIFKSTEEKASSIPIIGDAIRYGQRGGLEEFNVAIYNRALGHIGEKYKGPAGQEGIAAVGDKLSAAYEAALAKSAPNVVDAAFQAGIGKVAGMVPPSHRADFVDTIRQEVLAKVTPAGTLTPSVAKEAESRLGQLARDYKDSLIGGERQLARAYTQALSEIRSLVARNNPNIAPRIRAIDAGWSDLVQLENAARSVKVARAGGLVTPADYLKGIIKSDPSVRDRAFIRNEMANQEFAQKADRVLSNKYPDSGSIGRLLNAGALGGAGYAFLDPATLAAGGAAMLPYAPGLRRLFAKGAGLFSDAGAAVPYAGLGASGLLGY